MSESDTKAASAYALKQIEQHCFEKAKLQEQCNRLAAEVEALREHAVTLANTTFLTTIERCAAICEAHYNHEAKDCAEEIRALKDQA